MITLTDAYCRVNRARGLELLSPEDLLNACNSFTSEPNIPLCLHTFETTGVSVIQLVNGKFVIVVVAVALSVCIRAFVLTGGEEVRWLILNQF